MLVISTQNWSILAKFAKQNPAKSAVFYWLFLGEVSPRNFPLNQPIFSKNLPLKSFENWLFSAKIPRNRPIFLRLLTFLPAKIPRNRSIFPRICPWKSREILLFFPRNIRSPDFLKGAGDVDPVCVFTGWKNHSLWGASENVDCDLWGCKFSNLLSLFSWSGYTL